MKQVLILLTLGFLIVSLFLTGCSGKEIKVGSKMDPESLLLAQMMILLLSENGYHVIDKTPTGNTYDLIDAIKNKDIDICPEYTGNMDMYKEIKNDTDKKNDIEWLKPGPADSKWGIAIPERLKNIISDDDPCKTHDNECENATKNATLCKFFKYINDKLKDIKIICSYEFTVNQHALPAFQKTYKIELKPDRLFIIPGSNTEQMAKLADDNGWATMVFTTDGHMDKYNLVPLEDNCHAQEDFHPAPVVNEEIYKKIHREDLNRILTPLFASLNNDTLKKLNSQIGLRGSQAISEVARQYLIENGYFKYNERQMVQDAMDEMIKQIGLDEFTDQFESNPATTTNKMDSFPDKKHRLYWNWTDKTTKKPDYAIELDGKEGLDYPPITWRETRGTYSCDDKGIVTQESTGW